MVPLCRLCSMATIFQPPAEGGAKRPIVVAASMCADYLHVGHINLLEHAHSQGPVTVLLMTDDAMEAYKRRPFFSFADRKRILEAVRFVDQVVPFDRHPQYLSEFILEHKPKVFVHGSDWRTGPQAEARANVITAMESVGGTLYEPDYTAHVSSSLCHEEHQGKEKATLSTEDNNFDSQIAEERTAAQ